MQEVAQEAVPQALLPSKRRFSLLDACALASIGDNLKQRFQLAVLLDKPQHQKRLKPRYARFVAFSECEQCLGAPATLG